MLEKASKPKEFSRENVLKAIAEFIMCDDQVCELMLWMIVIDMAMVESYCGKQGYI